jgi:SAM-dependent methyltransferase
MRKLSVGYLVDEGYQPDLIYDLIEKSKLAEHYSIDYLIVQTFAKDKNLVKRAYGSFKKQGFLKFVAAFCFKAIVALESRVFVRDPKLKSAFDMYHLDTFHVPKIQVRPLKSTSGLVYRYREEDLEIIKSLNVDVLLRGGSGILRGEILNVCEFGIISFHHGNNDVNRGGPPGFWEVFNREPSTGFVIQRLPDELDGGDAQVACDVIDRDVLMSGSIATVPPYAQNLARIYKKSNIFMHRFLENLGKTRILPQFLPNSPYAHKLYTMPSLYAIGLYQTKTFIIMIRRLFNRLARKHLRWGVAYQFAENWQSSVLCRSNIIASPPYRFLADPFVFRRGNLDVCFVEDYDYRAKKGKISVFKLSGNKYEELGSALDEPFHLSYPFIFTVDNELYMCPETSEIREIRLYKCNEFPLRWSFHKTLMKDISAADTNIFFSKDRWWLLTNIDSSEMGDHNSELHVFSSDAFDSDAWTPHAKNPVIFDSERARNGGFFHDGEKLLRVFQRHGFDLYGESMGIAQIKDLGMETYGEEVVSRIDPRFVPKIIGTHSLSYYNGLLAIDFLKVERVKIKPMPADNEVLPNFAEHDEDTKNHPIETPIVPQEYIRRYLGQLEDRRRGPETLRIIDVGCGRGDTVAWLCAQGWDAYGIDILPEYIQRGREYLAREGADPARLQLLNDDFTYPFPNSTFDVVLSDQVIEHVADLELFASEVARISAPGACGLHIFPARWHPIEAHLNSPFVHWLPKGPLRRAAVMASLRIGLAAPYFREFSFRDRVEIFSRFSEEETFYRSLRSTIATMQRHGLRCDARLASRDKIALRLPTAPKAALPLLGWLYRHTYSVVLQTHKP